MNNWTGIGRVTKDIPLSKTSKGTSQANFTIAIRRDENSTDYVYCVAYGKRAETVSQYVKKGNRIAVTGSLQTWSVENAGRYDYKYCIVCDKIEFLENKESKPQKPREEHYADYGLAQAMNEQQPVYPEIDPNDLPF